MISAMAMAGVSAFVREAFGDRVLRRVNQAMMLDIEPIEHLDCFIPQATATTFLNGVERGAGEPNLGLLFVPEVSMSNFGLWGEYVLAADTLHAAIVRAASTLGHHCSGDRIELSIASGVARVCYVSAVRGRPGCTHLAGGIAAQPAPFLPLARLATADDRAGHSACQPAPDYARRRRPRPTCARESRQLSRRSGHCRAWTRLEVGVPQEASFRCP